MRRYLLQIALLSAICVSGGAEEENWKLDIEVNKKARTDGKLVQQWLVSADRVDPRIKEKNEHISFAITIKNLSKRPTSRCVAKYAIFGQAVEHEDKLVVVRGGTNEIDLAASETTTIEIDPVVFTTRTIDYPLVSREAAKDQAALLSAKSNSKEGVKYLGVTVAVYKGDEMIGSFATPNELKVKMAKEGWKAVGLTWK